MGADKEQKLKPMMILKKGIMSKRDRAALAANGLVVVEAADPDQVRFADPPPSNYDVVDQAAIALSRRLMKWEFNCYPRDHLYRGEIQKIFIEVLLAGQELERAKTVAIVKAKR